MTPEKPLADLQTPRQRLMCFGPERLTTTELLALLIGQGNANERALALAAQLLEPGGLIGLARKSLSELSSLPSVGVGKAAQIQATLEIGRRLVYETIGNRPAIQSPGDAARILMVEMAPLEQEHLRVLILDRQRRLIASHLVYQGSLNTMFVRAGEVYREAIRRNSAAIIVAHNHPSGDPSPSPEDVAVTRALSEAGKLLDILLLDHLIIGQGRFVSLKERGLGFP